jgi:hypothetical protein
MRFSTGRPLAIDGKAESASPTEPAFIARPEGAPVYHGFVVLDEISVDGFTLGKITNLGSGALRNRRCVRDCAGPQQFTLQNCESLWREKARYGDW